MIQRKSSTINPTLIYIATTKPNPTAPTTPQTPTLLTPSAAPESFLGAAHAVGFAVFSAPPVIATSKRYILEPVYVVVTTALVVSLPTELPTVPVQVASVVGTTLHVCCSVALVSPLVTAVETRYSVGLAVRLMI